MADPNFYVVDIVSHSNQLSLWRMPLTDLNPDRACNVSFKDFFPRGALHYVRGEDKGSFYAALPAQYTSEEQTVEAVNAVLHLGTSSDATLHAFQGFSVLSLPPTPEKYYELRLSPLRKQPLEARARGISEKSAKRGNVAHIPLAEVCAVGQIALVRESDYAYALDKFQQRIQPSAPLPAEKKVNAALVLRKHPPDCFDHHVLYGHVQIS